MVVGSGRAWDAFLQNSYKTVILRGYDLLIFVAFGTPNRNDFQPSSQTVILSEAPRGSMA
jgi:hypothetical protein